MRLFSCSPLCFLLALIFWPALATAHPHAWISVQTIVLLNDKNEAVALREHWLFDKMYTAYAVQDFNPNKNGKLGPEDLQKLAEENVRNLKDFDYFTVIGDPTKKKIALGTAKDISSRLEDNPDAKKDSARMEALTKDLLKNTKNYPPEAKANIKDYVEALSNRKQLSMDFTVPLPEPQELILRPMIYRIYDPTYYTDITHTQKDSVKFLREKDGKEIETCHAELTFPKINQEMIFQAAALDRNATAPKDLGYYFSEKVTLACSPQK